MHPWHEIKLGEQAPNKVPAVIEVPRGSNIKYELDKSTGLIRVDRTLYSSVFYPANYGFIPQTYCDDKDPLDILVLGQESLIPLCIVDAKPIGVMHMIDQGEEDDKIIAVQTSDPEFNGYESIEDLPQHKLKNLKRFFQDYKVLEGKEVIVEDFKGKDVALETVNTAIELYKTKADSLRKACMVH